MTAEITHHLAAAGRMADVNRIPQLEMIRDGLQIVGIMVHVVAIGHLRRTTMSAPIGRDDADNPWRGKKASASPNRPRIAANHG